MKIGIIGGGQLGMMMAEEAKKLGHKVVSLDPNPNCSITKFSDLHISKEYNNKEVLEYMYENTDVLTYEFENVDLDVLTKYIDKLPQGTEALRVSRDRIIEKMFAKSLGIKTPLFTEVHSKNDIFFPSIVKTTTGGYDGKGQYVVRNNDDIDYVKNIEEIPYICEEFIAFDYEISVVATRAENGNITYFPIPKNTHKNGILHISKVDTSVPIDIQEKARHFTKLIMKSLEYVGTLAVEFFVAGNDVIFNEFAPRPHNSGHYTMDGCNYSQFYTHIKAITKNILPIITMKSNTVMINVLGQNTGYYDNSKNISNVTHHDYFKNSTRENRKIGHINVLYKTEEEYNVIVDSIIKE